MKPHRHTLSYLLTPDYLFERFDQVTPDFLLALGIRGLLIDIDNTLAPYEQPEPDEAILAWFDALRDSYLFNVDNVDGIIKTEIGKTFVRVLRDAGVYKDDEAGRAGFLRFLATIGGHEV